MIELTEAQFERQIKELAAICSFVYYHTWRSFHSPSGYPDCTLVKLEPEPRLIYIELKSEEGQPTIDQYIWLSMLQHLPSPVECYLWRPSDWDEIVEVLRRSE